MNLLPSYKCIYCFSSSETDQISPKKQMDFWWIFKWHNNQHYEKNEHFLSVCRTNSAWNFKLLKKILICVVVGYLHSIWSVNYAAFLKVGKISIDFLSVTPERCANSMVLYMFLLIKAVWFEFFENFPLSCFLNVIPLYWYKDSLSSTQTDQISPQKQMNFW